VGEVYINWVHAREDYTNHAQGQIFYEEEIQEVQEDPFDH